MKEAALFTFTLFVIVYYFSTPKKLNSLEQIFLGLIASFIFSCYISIFADDLGWWKVNKDHHLVFKIVEIVAKTFLIIIFISNFYKGKYRFIYFFFYLIVFQLISWIFEGLDVAEYRKSWIFFGWILNSFTFSLLIYLYKKFHQVLLKEGLVDYEGTTTT